MHRYPDARGARGYKGRSKRAASLFVGGGAAVAVFLVLASATWPASAATPWLLTVECSRQADTLVHIEIGQRVTLRDGSRFDPSPPDPVPICRFPYLFRSDGRPLSFKLWKHSGPNVDITRVTLRPQPLPGGPPLPPRILGDLPVMIRHWEWGPADRYFTLFDGQCMHLATGSVSMRRCSDVCEPDACFPTLEEGEPFRIPVLPLKYPNVRYGYHCGGGHGTSKEGLMWDRVDKCCADHDAGKGGGHPDNFCEVKAWCDVQTDFNQCLDSAFAYGEGERARRRMMGLIGPLMAYCNDLTKAAAWVSCQFD